MPYATFSDVLTRYRPLATSIGTGAFQVTTADISSIFIADAESLVNGYLSGRYTIPLPTEPMVTQLTADLAIFNIVAEKLGQTPEFMQARYDRAMRTLEKLRDGEMFLSSSATLITSGDQEAWSSQDGYHPIFSPVLNEVDQAVDIDYVEAEQDARSDD